MRRGELNGLATNMTTSRTRMGWGWLFGRRRRGAGRRVVMYTRQGCHLCDEAWEVLERARRRHGLALSRVDVDTSAELAARYGLEVPVVEVDGRVRFRGGV